MTHIKFSGTSVLNTLDDQIILGWWLGSGLFWGCLRKMSIFHPVISLIIYLVLHNQSLSLKKWFSTCHCFQMLVDKQLHTTPITKCKRLFILIGNSWLTSSIPLANRPSVCWLIMSAETLPAPADCPNMVTLWGSPPNAAMFLCIHCRAALWSHSPKLPFPVKKGKNQSQMIVAFFIRFYFQGVKKTMLLSYCGHQQHNNLSSHYIMCLTQGYHSRQPIHHAQAILNV